MVYIHLFKEFFVGFVQVFFLEYPFDTLIFIGKEKQK